MTDSEIRMECMRLAVKCDMAGHIDKPMHEEIALANAYYQFVVNSTVPEQPTKQQ